MNAENRRKGIIEALENALNLEYEINFKDMSNIKAYFKTNIVKSQVKPLK